MVRNNKNNGFSLIEIVLGVLIFSFVIVSGFQTFTFISSNSATLTDDINNQKEAFYFSEKFFEMLKREGTLDYEEYFNRRAVGTNFSSGHYLLSTGFGNFGSGGVLATTNYGNAFYYCVSANGTLMGTGGCFNNNFNNFLGSFSGKYQRYGEYSLQFIDFNSNANGDNGDENLDGNIIGDDDDENLGQGPLAFSGGNNVSEIYLISGSKTKRTLFRWNVKVDPNKPSSSNCDFSNPGNPTGSGCLGTIEFLRLEGRDWGFDHNILTSDLGQFDGIIDTWLINDDFVSSTATGVLAGTGNIDSYWLPIFPDSVNITDFKVSAYPAGDIKLSWKNSDNSLNIAPYLQISFNILPSWEKRRKIKGVLKPINFKTTVSLTDILTK